MPDLIKPKIFDKTFPGDNHKLSPGMKNLYNEAYGHLYSKKSIEPKTEINNRLKSQEVPDNIKAKEISQPQTKMADKPNSNVHGCDIKDFAKQFPGETIAKLLGFARETDKIAISVSETGKNIHQNGDNLEQAGKKAIDSGKPISGSSLYETGQELKTIGQPLEQNFGFFPHRGEEDKYIDYKAAFAAYKVAGLDKYPGVTENLIPAIMRNEQHFYKVSDANQDTQIQKLKTVYKDGKEDLSASIGPAQIQIGKIHKLIDAKDNHGNPVYPYLQSMKNDQLRSAEDPKNAALLTAAYMADKAIELELRNIPINDKTLAYTWNYDVQNHTDGSYGSVHGLELLVEKYFNKENFNREGQKYPSNEEILKASKHVYNVLSNYPEVKQQKKNLKL